MDVLFQIMVIWRLILILSGMLFYPWHVVSTQLNNLGHVERGKFFLVTTCAVNRLQISYFPLYLSPPPALIRFNLKQYLIRKHQVIREGVVRAGKQNLLEHVYVEPQISTCCYGGVDPSHEFLPHPPTPLQVPSPDTFVCLNNLFRRQKADGQPVRTVLTTGIPGIGMTVSVGKFCLDWAELVANRVIIK